MSGDPRATCAIAGDAVSLLNGPFDQDWAAPGGEFRGNAGALLGWDLGGLKPGEEKSVSVTLAVVKNAVELRQAVTGAAFPAAPADAGPDAAELRAAARMEGAWVAAFPPNDLATPRADGLPEANAMGCCHPAGVRGVHACWEPAMRDVGGTLSVRLPICREGEAAAQTVSEAGGIVEQRISLRADRRLRVRIPEWASLKQVRAFCNGRRIPGATSGRWLELGDRKAGEVATVRYPLRSRLTRERVGGSGKSGGFAPAAEQREFVVQWRGSSVVSISPRGEMWPVFPQQP